MKSIKLTLGILPNGNFNMIANESVVLTDCYSSIGYFDFGKLRKTEDIASHATQLISNIDNLIKVMYEKGRI